MPLLKYYSSASLSTTESQSASPSPAVASSACASKGSTSTERATCWSFRRPCQAFRVWQELASDLPFLKTSDWSPPVSLSPPFERGGHISSRLLAIAGIGTSGSLHSSSGTANSHQGPLCSGLLLTSLLRSARPCPARLCPGCHRTELTLPYPDALPFVQPCRLPGMSKSCLCGVVSYTVWRAGWLSAWHNKRGSLLQLSLGSHAFQQDT